MNFDVIIKMTITPDNADTIEEGLSEAKLEANRIVNAINRENDYPRMDIIEVRYNSGPVTSQDFKAIDEAMFFRDFKGI